MASNREYKDSVFSLLFSNPRVLRELYGALAGVRLPPDVPIQINTLADVIFLEQLNDLSFIVAGRLIVLIEHQSTINPNMALRLLIYMGRICEKIVERRRLYSSRPISIPRPEFIVLYNGSAPYPDRQTMNLSELFEEAPEFAAAGLPPALELKVNVYNINKGHNRAIVEKSRELEGYGIFIDKVRELKAENGDSEKAMRMAIKYCIEHNVLREFLETNASEVVNMLLTEWSTVEYGEVQREEGREEGRGEGQDMVLKLVEQGYTPEQIRAKLRAGKAAEKPE
jgi:predicted transposase YdaD